MNEIASPGFGMADLTGKRFGLWSVLGWSHRLPTGKQYWRCMCACGLFRDIEGYNLTSGRSKSCRPCSAAVVAAGNVTHGMSKSLVYKRWIAMKTRCTNPKAKSWRYHGGIGVKVAPEWLNDFEAFYAHIGDPPNPLYTVDREDPFGDYAPGNVRWATQSEQMQNTRRAAQHADRRLEQIKAQQVGAVSP